MQPFADRMKNEPLRRRFMLAAVRLAQPGDPARLNDRDLFDLFAMLGEPDFETWQESIAGWERWQAQAAENSSDALGAPDGALTHREFDAALRQQRA